MELVITSDHLRPVSSPVHLAQSLAALHSFTYLTYLFSAPAPAPAPRLPGLRVLGVCSMGGVGGWQVAKALRCPFVRASC